MVHPKNSMQYEIISAIFHIHLISKYESGVPIALLLIKPLVYKAKEIKSENQKLTVLIMPNKKH
jgi:hypothetical protein